MASKDVKLKGKNKSLLIAQRFDGIGAGGLESLPADRYSCQKHSRDPNR